MAQSMSTLSNQYESYATDYLLERCRLDLTDEARQAITLVLLERGMTLEEIAAQSKASVAPTTSSSKLFLLKESNQFLSFAVNIAILVAAGFIFSALLHVEPAGATIKLWLRGDTDAAIFRLLGISCVFVGGAFLMALVNRRLTFFALAAALFVLLGLTVYYGFAACLIPACALLIGVVLLYKRAFHLVPVPNYLAILLSLFVYGLALLLLIAPLFH